MKKPKPISKAGRARKKKPGWRLNSKSGEFSSAGLFIKLLKTIKAGKFMGPAIIREAKLLIEDLPEERRKAAMRYLENAVKEGKEIRKSNNQTED